MIRIKDLRVLMILLLLCTLPLVISADGNYDTSKDPLITQSYLEQVWGPKWKQDILSSVDVSGASASLKKEIKAELSSELKAQLKNDLSDELKTQLKNELSGEISGGLKKELEASLTKSLTASLEKTMNDKISSALTTTVKKELSDAIKAELTASLTKSLGASLKESLSDELTASLTEELTASLSASLLSELMAEMTVQVEATVATLLTEAMDATRYRRVELVAGEKVQIASPCEIVLLSGLAVIGCEGEAEEVQIHDLSAGMRLSVGDELLMSHQILAAQGEGLFIQAQLTDAILMIRGEYTIAQPIE